MGFCEDCHKTSSKSAKTIEGTELPTQGEVLLIGAPNVGKSAIFYALTGTYTTVSNYPGTTVEIFRGEFKFGNSRYGIYDAPGIYSLACTTDEERVARSFLFSKPFSKIVHVIDSRRLRTQLILTLQLLDAGYPVVLVLNMTDEAERSGLLIDEVALSENLGIPVIKTSATKKTGIKNLIEKLVSQRSETSTTISELSHEEILKRYEANSDALAKHTELRNKIDKTLAGVVTRRYTTKQTQTLDRALTHPVFGFAMLLVALFVFYLVVGVFGAQIVVDLIDKQIYLPFAASITTLIESSIGSRPLQDLLIHDYGVLTLGLRYAFVIILPIVFTFFFAFAVIEDSGYMPRIAFLLDRFFKRIGLNGRGVIPIILGFGCATMATAATRTLETKKERIIATFLLSLAIPCSAQLGVISAILAEKPLALLFFVIFMTLNFLVSGMLASKLVKGRQPLFFLEIPPLRTPHISNLIKKTLSRAYWYLKEIIPIFLFVSIAIWGAQQLNLFHLALKAITPAVNALGLPDQASNIFLYGFLRRDYGAAGLYDLKRAGILTANGALVASITLALFVPCIAQFLLTIRERGIKAALLITGLILPYAFLMGLFVHTLLNVTGITI